MAIPTLLPCDGCGQLASPEHFSRRLQRLEWATRFRPIHIQALLLTAAAPESDEEFLYNPETHFAGLPGQLLTAVQQDREGKSFEEVLTDVRRRGLVLASALECPVEPSSDPGFLHDLLERHLPSTIARIRRSLKPKRVLVLASELQSFLPRLTESALGCPALYTPLDFSAVLEATQTAELAALRAALPSAAAPGTQPL